MPHFSITFSKPRIDSAFLLFMRGLAVFERKNQSKFLHIFSRFYIVFPESIPKNMPRIHNIGDSGAYGCICKK